MGSCTLLIPFHGEHIVGSLITHLAGNRFLTTHGFNGHRGPAHIEKLQQHGIAVISLE